MRHAARVAVMGAAALAGMAAAASTSGEIAAEPKPAPKAKRPRKKTSSAHSPAVKKNRMPHTGAKEKARAKRLFDTHPIYIHLATNHPGPEFARAEIRRMDRRQKKKEKHERETSAAAARKRWPLIRQQRREDRAAGRAS